MSETEFYINVGPLTNLQSLYYHVGTELPAIREGISKGEYITVTFDLQNLAHERINILTLVSFLSVSRRISETIGRPIKLLIKWDVKILGFLSDVGFFNLAKRLHIFIWDEGIVGGFDIGKTNPLTKLMCFTEVQRDAYSSEQELYERKNYLKQKIAPDFILRCNSILKEFEFSLINVVTNTTLELIVNSLVHGGDYAFVGLQRTSKRISISVADSGIGFRNSILKYNPIMKGKSFSHYEALVLGSLIQKKQNGLKLAINELLKGGKGMEDIYNLNWISISSYDSEIKWQRNIWESLDDIDIDFSNAHNICNQLSKDFGRDFLRKYSSILVGSRITFEIPLI